MILYDYYRSSAAYRVRIALNLKGLSYEQCPINLAKGEQTSEAYTEVNPQGLVPTLVCDNGLRLSQSNAICEYLEEQYPDPPLLPADAGDKARVRSLAALIACEIHPLANLRVRNYLHDELAVTEDDKLTWIRHWIHLGFSAFEALLDTSHTAFCCGQTPTFADVFLIPQVYNAVRFDCDLMRYPKLSAVVDRCESLEAFAAAAPDRQPDAPELQQST